MTDLVTVLDGRAVTTSLLIADGTQHEHRAVLKLLRDHLKDFEDFGRVAFEVRPFETAGGTQQREVAILNEHQATLLVTFMRNIGVVKAFKKHLVKAFYEFASRSAIAIPQNMAQALRLAADEFEKRERAERALAIAAPKIEAHDRLIAADGSLCLRDAAKNLGVRQNAFIQALNDHHWLYRTGDTWRGHAEAVARGYLTHRPHTYTSSSTETERITDQVKVTAAGLARLAALLAKWGVVERRAA